MSDSKLRKFFRTWVRPRTMDGVTIPITGRQVILASLGFIPLQLIYFSIFLPIGSISDKQVFVLALFGWASPWIVWAMSTVVISPRRANRLGSRMFILVSVVGLAIYAIPPGTKLWDSVLEAYIPGQFDGFIIGGVIALFWKYLRKR